MPLYALDSVHPTVPDDNSHWIAPNAAVMGDVHLGKNASVWFGATIRGDNEPIRIGDNSNIQDGSVLHTDPGFPLTIAENCVIGHMVMLHGCTIGENTLIGIGTTILNGTTIGKNCIIGANTFLPGNKTIPDNSMVIGAPGKVIRELTANEREEIGKGAGRYVVNANRFKDRLEELPGT